MRVVLFRGRNSVCNYCFIKNIVFWLANNDSIIMQLRLLESDYLIIIWKVQGVPKNAAYLGHLEEVV